MPRRGKKRAVTRGRKRKRVTAPVLSNINVAPMTASQEELNSEQSPKAKKKRSWRGDNAESDIDDSHDNLENDVQSLANQEKDDNDANCESVHTPLKVKHDRCRIIGSDGNQDVDVYGRSLFGRSLFRSSSEECGTMDENGGLVDDIDPSHQQNDDRYDNHRTAQISTHSQHSKSREAYHHSSRCHVDGREKQDEEDWQEDDNLIGLTEPHGSENRATNPFANFSEQDMCSYPNPHYYQQPMEHHMDCRDRFSECPADMDHWPIGDTQTQYPKLDGATEISRCYVSSSEGRNPIISIEEHNPQQSGLHFLNHLPDEYMNSSRNTACLLEPGFVLRVGISGTQTSSTSAQTDSEYSRRLSRYLRRRAARSSGLSVDTTASNGLSADITASNGLLVGTTVSSVRDGGMDADDSPDGCWKATDDGQTQDDGTFEDAHMSPG